MLRSPESWATNKLQVSGRSDILSRLGWLACLRDTVRTIKDQINEDEYQSHEGWK
jgi:hypothetical protein